MERVAVEPKKLSGSLTVPPSKSAAHRLLICASLASGESRIENVDLSQDISATVSAARALGSQIAETENGFLCKRGELHPKEETVIDCAESGSTLRFFIPIALALGGNFRFTGRGRLMERPLDSYFDICTEQGIHFEKNEKGLLFCGKLSGGTYILPGNVSSQYVSGLLFALPLLSEDSKIVITSPLESAAYVDMTLSALSEFGIRVENKDYREFIIRGGQTYKPCQMAVEGDYSQAAFYLVANALGSDVRLLGLDENSLQGDKAIAEIIESMGKPLSGRTIDVSGIPDLVPVLAVLATQADGETKLTNAARLRIKESDRLATTTQELTRLGADITELPDALIIRGKTKLCGAVCDAHNDHRIAMALAIAATACEGAVTICGADCVKKSYGKFWEDYQKLGGIIRG